MKSLVLILILSVMFQAKAKKNPDYIYKAAAQVRVFLLRHIFFSLWCVLSSFIIPAAMLHSNRLSSTILDRSRRYNLTVFSMEMTIQNFKLKCKNKILMKTEKLYSEEEVYYNT